MVADPRLDPYRALSDGDLLRRRDLFVAEGRLVVERVLRSGRYRVESVLLNDASFAALAPLLEAHAPQVPILRHDTATFQQITGFNIHRGCLALVRRPAAVEWYEAAAEARFVVVLEGVTNADNVGGVFRNAAAFGCDAVLLSPTCCDPLYRKAIGTSMGSVLNVPFARLDPWPAALQDLRDAGFEPVALTPRAPSVSLYEFARQPRASRTALVVGTEGAGLTSEAEASVVQRVCIPMCRGVDSLNLSVAVGVALSHLLPASRESESQPGRRR